MDQSVGISATYRILQGLLLLLGAVSAYKILFWLYCAFWRFLAAGKTLLLSLVRQQYVGLSANVRRSVARRVVPPTVAPTRVHTHPDSAADRRSALTAMEMVGFELGLVPFYLQLSRREEGRGALGSRYYVRPKDLQVNYRLRVPPEHSLICIVDCDHEHDMNEQLTERFEHYAIFSFQPTAVARVADEYSFTFSRDNKVHYVVSGGAQYCHEVWNYSVDVLYATKDNWLTTTVCVYDVERVAISADHSIVFLLPSHRYWVPRWVGFTPESLTRLQVVTPGGKFLRLHIRAKGRHDVSTGVPGGYNHSEVSVELDGALASHARANKTPVSTAVVMATTKIKDPVAATSLIEYHRSIVEVNPVFVFPAQRLQSYEFTPKAHAVYEMGKPSRHPFMDPLYGGAVAPTCSRGNDEQTIAGRVTSLANEGEPTLEVIKAMHEFADKLKDIVGELHPVDFDEVYANQARPMQQRILEEGSMMDRDPSDGIRPMQKKESYAEFKDPRNISPIRANAKLRYSRYIYALSHLLKLTKWYAFGKTPQEIAERVTEICMEANAAGMSDHKRMDGRVNKVVRLFERIVMLTLFPEMYHEELVELMATQFQVRGLTMFLVAYLSLWSRLSGSPETSAFNSLLSAFTVFLGYILDGMSSDEAWSRLGIYGGDDGLTADPPARHQEAARLLGQELELQVLERYSEDGYVNFLSRYYGPYVWDGDVNSCADIRRQLVKLHLCGVKVTTSGEAFVKLREKALAFFLTDKNTPILGEWARVALRLTDTLGDVVRTKDMPWFTRRADEDVSQFPNLDAGWMHRFVVHQFGEDFDYDAFLYWLARCDLQPALLLLCPGFGGDVVLDPHKTVEVVTNVGDDIISIPPERPGKGKEEEEEEQVVEEEMKVASADLGTSCESDSVVVTEVSTQPLQTPPEDIPWVNYCPRFAKTGECKIKRCKRVHQPRPKVCSSYCRTGGTCSRVASGRKCTFRHEIVVCELFIQGKCTYPECWRFHIKV